MFKQGRIYILICALALGLVFLIESAGSDKINWFPSYVKHHKIPYGTYVLNEILPLHNPNKIRQITIPPFEYLNQNELVEGSYFLVNNDISFGEAELEVLLDWVSKGNTLVVGSENFEEKLLDTLDLAISKMYNEGPTDLEPDFGFELANPNLKHEPISFKKDYSSTYFKKIDTAYAVVLGTVFNRKESKNSEKWINVIQQEFGEGKIILSCFPKAFTNYFILKDKNREYTLGLLSYLDGEQILVDNHYKSGKSRYTSPMHIFLRVKEFKWAYYMVLIGAVIYLVFEGKRKQRPIPVVTPLKNQTLAFTRTIADMYFEKNRQKEITAHKISYFLAYIRSRFHLATQEIDDRFIQQLAMRSSATQEQVKHLFKDIQRLPAQDHISDKELQEFNRKIEDFKALSNGRR